MKKKQLTAFEDRESRSIGSHDKTDAYLIKIFDAQEFIYRINDLVFLRDGLYKQYAKTPLAKSTITQYVREDIEQCSQECMKQLFLTKLNGILAGIYTNSNLKMAEIASKMLVRGELASNVALAVGFESYSYFGKCFKAKYGLTPSTYYPG